MDISTIRTFAREAALGWTGWEWPHDPGGHGIVTDGPGAVEDWDAWQAARRQEVDVDDLDPEAVAGMNADEIAETLDAVAEMERDYGEACQISADAAADHGAACVEAAERGDFAAALAEAEAAAALEREYGDDPAYRPLVEACREALDDESEGEDAAS